MYNKNRNNRNRNNNGNDRGAKEREYLTKMVERFTSSSFKKFKKKNKKMIKEEGISKKKVKRMYYRELIDLLPDVADWVFQYGFKKDEATREIMDGIYRTTLFDPDFMDALYKYLEENNKLKNQKDMPMFMRDLIQYAKAYNKSVESGENPGPEIDVEQMDHICMHFMEHNLRKFEKAGVPSSIAYNVLCVIPYPDVVSTDRDKVPEKYCRSAKFRVRLFFETLYAAAKTMEVPFAKIMKLVTDDDGDLYRSFIVYALLEKKDRYASLNESQKKFYLSVTNWTFDTLNQYDRDDILAILNQYIRERRIDDNAGRDCNRRYALSSLVESDYPTIVKTIKFMLMNDESIKKYL